MIIGIIGGGPAGLFTAIALKRLKYEVLVLEAGTYTKQRVGEHLGAAARTIIRSLDIPDHIIDDHSINCSGIVGAWGQKELLSRSSIFNPYGEGIILSRPAFDLALADYCRDQKISVAANRRVNSLKQIDDYWQINTNDSQYEVNFLVDASGRNSKFSKVLGTGRIVYDDLIGISSVLYPKQNHSIKESELLIESVPDGWWYSTQLASGDVVATFMTSAARYSALGQNQENFWMDQLSKGIHTSSKWADFVVSGKKLTQSAKTQILQNITGKRWLAVGDAAMSYDPLSSAGILKGIRMGISAASKINGWANGKKEDLEAYDQECRKTFTEYLAQKATYYTLEKRFNDCPFWYERNIRPKTIGNFKILPHQSLHLLQGDHKDKLIYLDKELPEVNFQTLLKCIGTYKAAQLVLKEYLMKNEEMLLNKHHFQAIEAMKLMGIITVT